MEVSVLVALGALVATTAHAQEMDRDRPATLDDLITCRATQASAARLSCYDMAVAALDQAERQGDVVVVDRAQVAAARRQRFGVDLPSMPNLFERGERAAPLDSIQTTLTRATQVANGLWIFVLDDGSTWRQVGMETTRFSDRPGQPVRVRRAAVGSYLMTIGNGRAVRVRRQAE